MAGFLYYLPGEDPGRAPGFDAARCAGFGLGYAFGPSVAASGLHRGGPDGGSGVIVAAGGRVKKVGYYPAEQTWQKIPGSTGWIGLYSAQPPGPADLVREVRIPGHAVELLDGRQWEVPLARGWSDREDDPGYYAALPRSASTVDEAGDWVPGEIDAKYASLWDIATTWWDAKHGAIRRAIEEEEVEAAESLQLEFGFAGLHDKAVAALAVNYRVSRIEASILGLLQEQAAARVLDALVDWSTYLVWLQKKTGPAVSGT